MAAMPMPDFSGHLLESTTMVDLDNSNNSVDVEDDGDDFWTMSGKFIFATKPSPFHYQMRQNIVQHNVFLTITSPPPELI